MRQRSRFAIALALGIAVAVGALAATIAAGEQDGLPVEELLRVEPVPTDTGDLIDDQLRFLSGILDQTQRFTDDNAAQRLAPELLADFPVDELNDEIDRLIDDLGAYRWIRITDRSVDAARLLIAAEDGSPVLLVIPFDADGRLAGLGVAPVEGSQRRMPISELSLILLAGSVLILASAAAWRYRAVTEAWMLLGTAVASLAATAVLSDSGFVYAIGRSVPNLVVVLAAALLIGGRNHRRTRWIMGVAMAAGFTGAVAPFARDSELIGHPRIGAFLADDEFVYRTLLGSSAGLTMLAMGGIAALSMTRTGRASASLHQTQWVASTVAAIWAVVAAGTALDLVFGEGTLAGGPFKAATWSATAAVAAVVVFRLISSRWDRPEIATLVIDLEGEGADLAAAISKALDDPSLDVLTSPDGASLTDSTGAIVATDELPEDRALTEIRSGARLVGALLHNPKLNIDPERIAAVAAAAGMALEVSRLNRMVTAQLEEVNASRARIVQASDTARRRIERDLHDGAQQRLVALGLRLQHAGRAAGPDTPARVLDDLEAATAEVRGILDDIRAVSRGAQPALLAERGLAPAVDALAERAPVPVHIDITADQLRPEVQTTAYFVIAESLTNVAKHANAGHAAVAVSKQNGCAHIQITDDGHGGATLTPGSGLEGLNDRVAAAGGSLHIASNAGGTTVKVTIPCG